MMLWTSLNARNIKSCCSEKSSMNSYNENNDFHNKDCIFFEQRNKFQNTNSVINVKSLYSVKNKW